MRGPTQNTRNQTVNVAENDQHEQRTVTPHHDLESQPAPTRAEDPLQQQGQHQQDVQRHRLHGVEPHVAAEARVPHHPEVQREECHEARVRHGAVQAQQRQQRVEQQAQLRELQEHVATVLEGVEEREGVGHR